MPDCCRRMTMDDLPPEQIEFRDGAWTHKPWSLLNVCSAHDYQGVPPCPYPECYAGRDRLYIAVRVVGLGRDAYEQGVYEEEERIFHRRKDGARYYWRELMEKAAA